jgi:hypothetical protein
MILTKIEKKNIEWDTSPRPSDSLNKINIEGLKDMVILLKVFQDVITLIQHGDRPTLHMVYVGLNKLKLDLSGYDVESDGEQIIIDDRHEGNTTICRKYMFSNLFLGNDFFRKRLKQLLSLMF